MDNQRNPLLSFAYYSEAKMQSVEDLKHSLLYTTLELEQTRVAVQEELKKRDDQLLHLKDLLGEVVRERDAAQEKCQRLLYEKLLLQQQQQQQKQQLQAAAPLSGISSIEDESKRGIDSNNGFSSSDCEESIVSSPVIDPLPQLQQPPQPQPQLQTPISMTEATIELLQPERPLPEKGKLLQAVMKAGPLLQTLLLAGPLPQWRHPPPPMESFEIPPVTIPSPPPPLQQNQPQLLHQQDSLINNISGCSMLNNCGKVNRKRVLCDASYYSPTETQDHRLILH